jgi:hypothetical protein
MVTGHQLQAARVLAGLGVAELSAHASLTPLDLERLEAKGADLLPDADKAVAAVKAALAAAGIHFIDEGGPGVQLRLPTAVDEGMRPEALNAENDD